MMVFRRRKEKKTDYKKRLALLKSRKTRLVVRPSSKSVRVQLADFTESGDVIKSEATSKMLRRYGWKGHGGNLPAAYLTGLLAALMARKNGVEEAVLDAGLEGATSRVMAAAFGAAEAIKVPIGTEPDMDRISGSHISGYAEKLGDSAREVFSAYYKNGLDPSDMQKHFEEVKSRLLDERAEQRESREEDE